jgi:protein-tyrosine phosphatase
VDDNATGRQAETRRGAIRYVGEPVLFEGYADDFDRPVAAVQFSLDGGATWTSYPARGAADDRGLSWSFTYIPQTAGRYVLRARGADAAGTPSAVVSSFAFEVLDRGRVAYGSFGLRPVGGALETTRLFRSGELAGVSAAEASWLINVLGLRTVYDIRNQKEVVKRPEPCLAGVRMVAVAPSQTRPANARRRLRAGVIGEYGAPEERMCANYRRYVSDYPLIGMVLRSLAAEGVPALVHCKNGKDRTGVLCAVALRLAGFDEAFVMDDYLAFNETNAALIARDAQELGEGMTPAELLILMSFLEARPAYLEAFFAEVDRVYGSFDGYVRDGLRLTAAQRERVAELVRG